MKDMQSDMYMICFWDSVKYEYVFCEYDDGIQVMKSNEEDCLKWIQENNEYNMQYRILKVIK